ncbi:ferredoxin reductase [Gordonia insulae]|uniref:NADPH oxidoreductase n=1 Tax=Gordonia insulae TaxID=2420509 RepID=A0A3G8JKL8_9ACTN|nr:FAD-binding oxidoreductase [Gordonia insulae]AZG45082.1 NADPH oxidoreductase [Gordonia insulae]
MSIRIPDLVGSIVEAALSPHPVDRYLELVDPMMTWRDLRAKVVAVDHPTSRTVRLTLQPTRQWQGHSAGQYVQLSTVINGVRHVRCFSPANAANTPSGALELTITAHDDGFVSSHLREHAHAGMVVGLSQAAGEFTLPDDRPRSAVFISGGSGITPVLSMVRTLVTEGYPGPITFVHYARTPADVAYRAELTALAGATPAFDLRLHYTRGDDAEHFTAAHLADIPRFDDAHLFVCGPPALMNAVDEFYDTSGLTQPLHSEAFTLAAPIAVDPDAPVDGELTFLRSGRSATNDGRTILDQAESAGLSPESGCRMGICFSCTAIKKSGCTRNVLTGETDTEADTQIQLCINAPVGDVEIEV